MQQNAARPVIGILFGSDSARLPAQAANLNFERFNVDGNNDSHSLIDARRFEASPFLIAPNYLGRRWRYELSRYAVIVNSLSDPDINPTSLMLAVSALAGCEVPVINDPRNIIRTRRDIASGLLAGLPGLLVPRTIRLAGGEPRPSQLAAIQHLRFPVLLRPAGSHTGHKLVKLEAPEELDDAIRSAMIPTPAYVTEFSNFRSPDGFYRKIRLMMVGRECIIRHVLADEQWLIHAASREFMNARPELNEQERQAMAHPQQFLPPGAQQLMLRIQERLGLDYFGIDCARMESGNLLLFETNASMNMLPATPLPHSTDAVNRVAMALNRLIASRMGAVAARGPALLH